MQKLETYKSDSKNSLIMKNEKNETARLRAQADSVKLKNIPVNLEMRSQRVLIEKTIFISSLDDAQTEAITKMLNKTGLYKYATFTRLHESVINKDVKVYMAEIEVKFEHNEVDFDAAELILENVKEICKERLF